jgi:hypothetical protein
MSEKTWPHGREPDMQYALLICSKPEAAEALGDDERETVRRVSRRSASS